MDRVCDAGGLSGRRNRYQPLAPRGIPGATTRGLLHRNRGDERGGIASSITYAQLIIDGVPAADSDHDGLDDNWEMRWFGSLAYGPQDNPGWDGYSNARKQCLDLNPTQLDPILAPDLSFWDDRLARISFPAVPNQAYQIRTSANLNPPFTVLTNVTGRLPELEFFVPYVGNPRPNSLECGGKRSATPLWLRLPMSKSGVAASLCPRTPNSSLPTPSSDGYAPADNAIP